MADCENNGCNDVSSVLSSSHKRGGCNPPTFATAPEAKRSLLYLSGCNLTSLDTNGSDGDKIASTALYNSTDFDVTDSQTEFEDDVDLKDTFLIFDCETDRCDFGSNARDVAFTTSDVKQQQQFISNQKGNEGIPLLSDTVRESESEYNNIANTSDYIGSLLSIISGGASENSYNGSSYIDDDVILPTTNLSSYILGKQFVMPICDNSPKTKGQIVSSNLNKLRPNYGVDENFNRKIVTVSKDGDEEDLLLRDLPTSVDDFQTKESHLKLERNYSSPRISRRQSPTNCGNNNIPSDSFLLPTQPQSNSSLTTPKNGSMSNIIRKDNQLILSDTLNAQCDDLDDNDLEVAMINESFEEQQKQSLIYERMDLKSLFYGVSSNDKSRVGADDYAASNKASTSATEEEEDAEGRPNFNSIGNTTPLVKMDGNEFMPLLTPKSHQFVMQRKKQFNRPGKYAVHSSLSNDEDKPLSDDEELLPLGIISDHVYTSADTPSFNNNMSRRYARRYYNDNDHTDEKSDKRCDLEELYNEKVHHRLDLRLKKMMLEGDDSDEKISSNLSSPEPEYLISNKSESFADCENYSDDSSFAENRHFLEEIAAKAMCDNDDTNDVFCAKSENTINKKETPKLPEVLMGLGPSTSSQNFFTITTAGALTPDICHFYIPPTGVNSISDTEEPVNDNLHDKDVTFTNLSEANATAKAIAYDMIATLLESPITVECNDPLVVSNNHKFEDDMSNYRKFSIGTSQNESENVPDENTLDYDNDSKPFDEGECINMFGAINRRGEEDSSVELSASDLLEATNICDDETDDLPLKYSISETEFSAGEYSAATKKQSELSKNESDSWLHNSSSSAGNELNYKGSYGGLNTKKVNYLDDCEQQVPILDSWENLEDEDLAAKMVNEAKSVLNKAKAEKNNSLFKDEGKVSSLAKTKQPVHKEFESLSHVVEASYHAISKNETAFNDTIQFLTGNDDVWHKKIDNKHYLLIFSSVEKAFGALSNKNYNTNFMKLKTLENAAEQSQNAAIHFKSQLVPKKKRPTTTASVARRMIANSLNMHIEVPEEQRMNEMKKLADARQQKRQKNAIWDD